MDTLVAAGEALNRNLIIMHGLVAFMRWQLKSGLELLVLAQHAKAISGQ